MDLSTSLGSEACEISVLGHSGLPAESILSVRAGATRRQKVLSKCDEPFVFCGEKNTCLGPLQVDILLPVASSGLLHGVAVGQHTVPLTPLGCVEGKPAGCTTASGARESAMSVTLNVLGTSLCSSLHRSSDEVQRYIEKHCLMDKLTDVVKQLFRLMPEDPIRFIAKAFGNASGSSPRPANDTSSGIAVPQVLSSLDWASDSLHLLPTCAAYGSCTRLLDFGSGETGFYTYEMQADDRLSTKSQKRKASFFASYVEPRDVDAFCTALTEEFGLVPGQCTESKVVVYCGATGLHRDILQHANATHQAQVFLRDAEQEISKRLGAIPVRLRLFVPSGQLEAQLELRATEWLIKRAGLLDPSCAGFMQVKGTSFSGTLSAGGGSCQMAMMSGTGHAALQVFSVPVGNRVPLVEGFFSKPVEPEELQRWRAHIRSELKRSNFPRGAVGFYVGISATFHAVNQVGLADRPISKKVVVDALREGLERLTKDDQRSVANLMLVQELLDWVFDERAILMFKRNWRVDNMEYVASWSLGMFTQQYSALMMSHPSRHPGELKKDLVAEWRLGQSAVEDRQNGCCDTLLAVPFVAWPMAPSCLLDFGSGETGLYVFEGDLVTQIVASTRTCKIADPIYEGFVAKSRCGEFADSLISQFGFQPSSARSGTHEKSEIIVGGATGHHRELLLNDMEKRAEMLDFFGEVERAMEQRLGRSVRVSIFVPSGELEAQFELRAVAWLIAQPDVDVSAGGLEDWMVRDAFQRLAAANGQDACAGTENAEAWLKSLGIRNSKVQSALQVAGADSGRSINLEAFRAAVRSEPASEVLVRRFLFSGTISAGGGSSQLSLTGCSIQSTAQLFSMPLGNRLPILESMFSTPVTNDEKCLWVERIRDSLASSKYPQALCGLFVGISAVYHACKQAGLADRVVGKLEVIKGLSDALAKLDGTDHRQVANLMLVKELIAYAFHDERSCFLFKRNWHAGGSSHVATWTLGWYVSQFEGDFEVREGCVTNMQRIARGRQVRAGAK